MADKHNEEILATDETRIDTDDMGGVKCSVADVLRSSFVVAATLHETTPVCEEATEEIIEAASKIFEDSLPIRENPCLIRG